MSICKNDLTRDWSGHLQSRISNTLTVLMVVCLIIGVQSILWAASSGTNEDAMELFKQGQINQDRHNYENAIRDFTKAIKLLGKDHPNVPQILLSRAKTYYHTGSLKRAGRDATVVAGSDIADQETKAKALILRGEIYLRSRKTKSAEADFTKALKTYPYDKSLMAQAWAYRGMSRIAQNRLGEAISDLSRAVELQKNYAFAYAAMGVAYMKYGNDAKARHYAERALALDPDSNTTKLASKVIHGAIQPVARIESVSVPIGRQGHVFVDVRFGKRGKPHTFLLDTGATHTVVRPELLPEIEKNTKVRLLGTGLVSLADGSRRPVNRYRVSNVFLDKLSLGDIEVHVFQGKAENIPNLLGINSLKRVTVSMNNTAGKAEIKLNSK